MIVTSLTMKYHKARTLVRCVARNLHLRNRGLQQGFERCATCGTDGPGPRSHRPSTVSSKADARPVLYQASVARTGLVASRLDLIDASALISEHAKRFTNGGGLVSAALGNQRCLLGSLAGYQRHGHRRLGRMHYSAGGLLSLPYRDRTYVIRDEKVALAPVRTE
jgi:hypothetical protein